MINELAGRNLQCSNLVPRGEGYETEPLTSRSCDIAGATPGTDFVSGTRYIEQAFDYSPSHRWRNFGIVLGFTVFFLICNLITSEVVASAKSKGEVLVFLRGKMPSALNTHHAADVESTKNPRTVVQGSDEPSKTVLPHRSVFHWRSVCYDVQIKDETRRILDHVDGWVKPGTLTALMVSGQRRRPTTPKLTLLGRLRSRENNPSRHSGLPNHHGRCLG